MRYLSITGTFKFDKKECIKIENSKIEDIDTIFRLYKFATDFQKTKPVVNWPQFDRTMIEKEISENSQWKIIINNQIACIWATTFSDPLIWEERNKDAAIYIHRIVTHPDFRGQQLVSALVEWAKKYSKTNGKNFIRMDTVGENLKLIEYYKSCGFDFLGLLN